MERSFGMRLEIRVGVDFGKLAQELPKIMTKSLSQIARVSADRAKESIDSGKFEPISDATRYIRKKGYSPASGNTATSSTKPLVHTGNLRRSIKQVEGGIQMAAYGKHHLESGRTEPNSFTKSFNFAGKPRPARNFLSAVLKPSKKEISEWQKMMMDSIRKALRRKSPLVLKT